MFDTLGRITELREAHKMTVYKLAKLSGIPQSTFVTWYSHNRYPGVDKIELICNVFGITLPEFFCDTAQMEKGTLSEELADLNTKYMILAEYQKQAVKAIIDAFLHE